MIMAAHQPHYLPWLGYFHKMAACDLFIYLDDVQFKKREFQNRNKIRVKDGAQWLSVPVLSKGKYDQPINQVAIENAGWAKDHWTAIQLAYKKAPFFSTYAPRLEDFYRREWKFLSQMSEALNEFQREVLQIKTPIRRASEFSVTTAKSRRLIDLCRAAGADTYLSGQGARDYLEENLFQEAGIKLIYQEFHHPTYDQLHKPFEPYMSALDLIFNCGPQSGAILMNAARSAS